MVYLVTHGSASFPEDEELDKILARGCVILTGCLQHLGLKGAFSLSVLFVGSVANAAVSSSIVYE